MRPLFVSYDYRLANAGRWQPRVGIILMSGTDSEHDEGIQAPLAGGPTRSMQPGSVAAVQTER